MRILMLSHGYPPTLSGVTRVVQKLSRDMIKRGHTVCVVAASEHGSTYRAEDDGVQLIRLSSYNNPFWRDGRFPWINSIELQKIIDSFKPDLIHSHENVILSTQLLRLKPGLNVPVIVSCYFLPVFATYYLRLGKTLGKLSQQIQWKFFIGSFNKYDHAIFSTHSHLQPFLEHGLSVPTSVISNGIDFARYNSSHETTQANPPGLSLPPRPRMLFVSRLARDKKIDVLLKAMPSILSRQEVYLLLVGQGDDHRRLQNIANKLLIADHVHFMGYVPETLLPAVYKASDLFALVSDCEVQSIPTLQALAAGVPVVAANAAALPELVKHGVNGYLVPPDDPASVSQAVLQLLSDRPRASMMGREGIEIARKHSDVKILNEFENLYRALTNHH